MFNGLSHPGVLRAIDFKFFSHFELFRKEKYPERRISSSMRGYGGDLASQHQSLQTANAPVCGMAAKVDNPPVRTVGSTGAAPQIRENLMLDCSFLRDNV